MDDDIAISISRYFEPLPDPRIDRTRRHKLADIVTITICAVIAGADDWEAVASFGRANEEWFGTFLELPGGIPAHDTFWRVFRALDSTSFELCFSEWTSALRRHLASVASEANPGEASVPEVIAIDGKQVRRSHDRCMGSSAIHLVSAWATQSGLVLGQVKLDAKESEIVAVPELLQQLHVAGVIVTLDALNCQVRTAQTIVDKRGDYLLALKENQPALHEEVALLFDDLAASGFSAYEHSFSQTVTSGHGRIETRRCWVISDKTWIDRLPAAQRWPKLTALIKIESQRRIKNAAAATANDPAAHVSRETRYYIASADLDAATVIAITRAHWEIENSLHWILDMAFREDDSRVRKDNGAENFAILRRIALNLIKQEKSVKLGVKNKRLKAGWDHNYLLLLLRNLTM
jgi:predicted transposase YbfD/YdcC